MSELDLGALISGGELDRDVIDRLKNADPEEVRATLSQYLPDAEVSRILERIRQLIAAAPPRP